MPVYATKPHWRGELLPLSLWRDVKVIKITDLNTMRFLPIFSSMVVIWAGYGTNHAATFCVAAGGHQAY